MAAPNTVFATPNQAQGILRGAMIACEDDDVPIENVRIGDIVNTLSDGPQVVRWVGNASNSAKVVEIKAGALGRNTPIEALIVAPAQRMVVSGWQAEVLFSETRVMVSAEALVNGESICYVEQTFDNDIYHILFDKHEVIVANGAASESFYPSKAAINGLSPEERDALVKHVPELNTMDPIHPFNLVHPVISAAEAGLLR